MNLAELPLDANPTRIECLACGATRIAFGIARLEAGECPRCHYLGWSYSDELDGSVRRLIMNGGLATRPRPERVGGPASRAARPRRESGSLRRA